jgi:hypothetical protein
MTTLALARWRQAHSFLWARYAGVSAAAWIYVACAVLALTGLMWDGAWHASWGRDTFFIPPHDLMYTAITTLFLVSAFILVSSQQFGLRTGWSESTAAPAGVWAIFIGCMILFAAAPYDDWYHRTYGVDNGSGLWSPPHFMGMIGGLIGCLGILLLLRMERQEAEGPDTRVRGLRGLNANEVLTLLMFAFITLIVGALSLNFWAIRYWYRVEGTWYPFLGLLFGPMTLVIVQRVTRRAGSATVAFLFPFLFIGAMGAILTLLKYPIVVSLPVMGLPSALALDLLYKRYGSGYRWLLLAGPLCGAIFYVAEFFWAWFFTGQPWHNLGDVLWVMPAALLYSTATMLVGAWLVTQLEQVNYFLPRPKRAGALAR